MKKLLFAVCIVLILVAACGKLPSKFTITYYGNGNDYGFAPVDNNEYSSGELVPVKDKNTLVKTGYAFGGWNTKSDGTGIPYAVGSEIKIENINIHLHAVWVPE